MSTRAYRRINRGFNLGPVVVRVRPAILFLKLIFENMFIAIWLCRKHEHVGCYGSFDPGANREVVNINKENDQSRVRFCYSFYYSRVFNFVFLEDIVLGWRKSYCSKCRFGSQNKFPFEEVENYVE